MILKKCFILSVTKIDLAVIAVVSAVILTWFFLSLKQLTFLSLSEESAIVAGINVPLQTLLFYISLAVATVLGVKILGIILVSALLVLPSAISRIWTNTFFSYVVLSLVAAEFTIISGIVISYLYDLPSGAVIILVGTLIFLLSSALQRVGTVN